MKICSKTHQIAPFKTIFRGSMPRTPIANPWLRQASQAPPPPQKKNSWPPLANLAYAHEQNVQESVEAI